jgi:hypothetical protein
VDLPRWNNEWDPQDLLKGRRAWAMHHYVGAGVFALLLLSVAGLAIPAIVHLRQTATKLKGTWERTTKAREEEIGRTIQPP